MLFFTIVGIAVAGLLTGIYLSVTVGVLLSLWPKENREHQTPSPLEKTLIAFFWPAFLLVASCDMLRCRIGNWWRMRQYYKKHPEKKDV